MKYTNFLRLMGASLLCITTLGMDDANATVRDLFSFPIINGKDGKDGKDGADAPTPTFVIDDGDLKMTVEGTTTTLGTVKPAVTKQDITDALGGPVLTANASDDELAAALARVLLNAGTCTTVTLGTTEKTTCESDLAVALRNSVIDSGAGTGEKADTRNQ